MAGGRWVARHRMRRITSPSTVMPIDLWVSMAGRTQSSGKRSTERISAMLTIISSAMIQCSAMAVRV